MKKIVPIILSVMAAGCAMIGCGRSIVVGIFKVTPGLENEGCIINGFSEEFTDRSLFIPDKIGTEKIALIGHSTLFGLPVSLKSETLEKIVLPNYRIDLRYAFLYLTNLTSIVFSWNGEWEGAEYFWKNTLPSENVKIYLPEKFMANYKSETYFQKDVQEFMDVANVEYDYNYQASPNDGIYLADRLNQGEEIYLAAEPRREGYEFGGWYGEPECVTKIAQGALYEGGVLRLYAKWNP